jgi:peptidoglycan/LPS O-acetylase OafA/YrhL
MSDVVQVAVPGSMDWLYNDARMAVQVFLVVGGFLFASAFFRQTGVYSSGAEVSKPKVWRQILKRFLRLAPAYWAALLVSVAVSAAVRPWFDHPSVPDAPTLYQAAAHVLLLQDVLGQAALSAGIWYVAIDLQLYALATLGCGLIQRCDGNRSRLQPLLMAGALAIAALSFLVFNRDDKLDITALYFFGAYGLGMLAFWVTRLDSSKEKAMWVGAMMLITLLALWVDFRERIALALCVASALMWWYQRPQSVRWQAKYHPLLTAPVIWLTWIGKRSYSIFLIHFPVCLLFNAVFARTFAEQLLPNALGMVAAFGTSVLAGALLYQQVEMRAARKSAATVPTQPAALA